MTDPAPDLARRISKILREDRGRLLAALIRTLGQFDLAEDALQDALERALVHWARSGIPTRPDAWLLQVARRAAIDRLRRTQRFKGLTGDITRLMEEDEAARASQAPEIPDERLRLIFTCCHPALEEKTRIALTLRTIGGLTTKEIARAFLDTDTAMGQRLSRAKAKIAAAAIPYRVPDRTEWDTRLNSVLSVIYLIFNEGWTAGPGEEPVRTGLCDEGIWLARMLITLAPEDPEIEGLLALMLLARARQEARFDGTGVMISLDAQNRALWNRQMIDEGLALLDFAVARRLPGPFQLQAAISALHIQAETPADTDWSQILLLYNRLYALSPSPVIRLNRAIALAEADGLHAALRELEALQTDLADYQPYHAALAELSCRAGRNDTAELAYERAIDLSQSEAERNWLKNRRAKVEKKSK